eukprot:177547-Chlamydomonas_euryale.AAC.1
MWLHALAQKRLSAICVEFSRRLPSHRDAVSRAALTSRLRASGGAASGVLKPCVECESPPHPTAHAKLDNTSSISRYLRPRNYYVL